jgi:hypothetical protein
MLVGELSSRANISNRVRSGMLTAELVWVARIIVRNLSSKFPKTSTFNDVSKDVMIPDIVDEYCSDFVVQISYQGKISVLEVSTKQITRPPGWALFGFIEIPSNVNLYLNRTVMIENFLEGTFRKWSNNWMYVDPVVTDINEVMQVFSHYSWARSKGKLLICDLQGVVSDSDVTLTDPAIHSIGRKYGGSDMGIMVLWPFSKDTSATAAAGICPCCPCR